jgi:cell division protein ZapA (FtsZ GTPase activity inhibitor)
VEKRVVEVVLQGRRFTLRTEEDEDAFREIVRIANERLDEVAGQGNMAPQSVALLAVLSLAQELWKERQALGSLRERIRVKSALILDMLEVSGRAEAGDGPPA